MDKYQPNTLRKGRLQALEKDFHDAYTLFSSRQPDPRLITITDFHAFWTTSQLHFLVHIRCQDEDEDQFFQAIDKILINEYFMKESEEKKIYALLCLYFFAYWVDNNGERNYRAIHVTPDFITALSAFLRKNAEYSRSLFLKVVKKIKELFVYSIKTGFRDPLIKKSGETYVRYPKPVKRLTRDNYSPTITEIKQVLPSLEETIKGYQESKDKFFKAAGWEEVLSTKKEMTFDKNLTLRLDQILKSYDAEVTYMEEDLKNIEEREE